MTTHQMLKWIPHGLLALAFLAAGAMKLITPHADLLPQMPWAADFSPMSVKLIAAVEVLGALGLILPVLLKRYLFLVPLAALGLGLTMVGAMITHIGRGEPIWINLGLLALSLGVAYLRKDWFRGVKA